MNLILHQFKTDVLHFRWRLLGLWLVFAIRPVMNALHSMSGEGMGITGFFVMFFQVLFVLTLVLSVIQTDPLTGDTAAWLGRPIRRRHLFWAKSAFILVCLILPWLAMWCSEWIISGYSWHLGWVAAGQTLMITFAGVLTVAVLAALTSGMARFFLAVAIVVGGIFAWVVMVEMLVRMSVLTAYHSVYGQESQRGDSALTVAWLVLVVCAFIAWLWQARAGRLRNAIVWLALGLLSFPIITTVWSKNFLAPKLSASAPVTLSMADTNHPAAGLQGQWLSSEFLLTGVPDHQVAVIEDLSAWVYPADEHRQLPLPWTPHNTSPSRIRPAESPAEDQYLSMLRDCFPTNTVWFVDNYYGGTGSAFDQNWFIKQYPGVKSPLKLDGELTVDLFKVEQVADLPVQPVSVVAIPGLRLTIQNVHIADGVISLSIDESSADLMLDRAVDTTRSAQNQALCSYVLYHPGSGEAFMVGQNNSQQFSAPSLAGENQRIINLRLPYPALREKLAGVTAVEWLKEAHLVAFAPLYAGTSRLTFQQDDFKIKGGRYLSSIRNRREQDAEVQAIQQATLPADFTPAQLDAYLDQLLLNVPDQMTTALIKQYRQKFAAIGTNGLPALLNRLPLSQYTENSVVFPAIRKLITRDQLPALRAALQRDDNVVELFRMLHWDTDVQDVMVAELSDHAHPMSAESLVIAAGAKDPATYADLRWRFVHLPYDHDQVVEALEQCPDFDVAGAVREAWQNARLGEISTANLAIIAARYDLPGALDAAVGNVAGAETRTSQEHALDRLISLTGYTGSTNNALPWLVANLDCFRYDAAQQRYTPASTQP